MLKSKPIAHSENDEEQTHFLADHLYSSAGIMVSLLSNMMYKDIFYLTGLLHDFGKYQKAFQEYLLENGPRTPHAAWGAALARKLKLNEASFAIDGHHKGLPDKIDWQISTDKFIKTDLPEFKELTDTFMEELNLTKNDFLIQKPTYENIFERELFVRYLFSALTDADWLDTERHFNLVSSVKRMHLELNYNFLLAKIENELSSKNKKGKINQLRNEARIFALSKAQMKQGFFSLNLPTGLGKTLTSVNWALLHAKYNHLKRIIIVLPFVNIIDQTALELKRIFGKKVVLEHHSSYNEENDSKINDGEKSIQKLATENWDYPIIITTTVQFFESLFSNKPSKCRKVHNIANAVVIFDEVQILPKELVTPTLTMLKNVQRMMKTSFLFCTATQPAFEKNRQFENGIDFIFPLVENPVELFKVSQRVKYTFDKQSEQDIETIIQKAGKKRKALLAVFNTKKKALQAFELAELSSEWDICFHLSTSMCPAHRKDVIGRIKSEIKKTNKRTFVASTQLIEAGVDLDFPVVFREHAPLDSIIQAAGRCNREGNLENSGEVYVFRLSDKTMPDPLYSSLSDHTLELLNNDFEIIYDPSFYTEYYLSALKLYVDDDRKRVNNSRKSFNFKTTAAIYRIVDNPTKSLFIWNYNQSSKELYERLKYKPGLSRDDFREVQLYSVQVYDAFLNRNLEMWEEKSPGFRVWFGNYHMDSGIVEDINLAETII